MNQEMTKRQQIDPPVDATQQADIEEELSALEFIRNLFELQIEGAPRQKEIVKELVYV
jgi:hypothetical protein